MLLLQAVYWFNPFVWLAFRQIRTDIEVACDSAVARPLSGEEKSDYAGLIISMFTSSGWQMALGMARGDSRKVAEQRVRGIFASGRSRKSAALVSGLLAALLLVGCFTTACQPTPTEPIVQSKMGDTVQRAIESSAPESTAEIYHFSAPATWQSELSDEAKAIAIKVDAQVTVPTDTWGIYQLSTINPDKAYIDGVLKALIGDAKIYGEDTYLSRSELEQQLSGIEQEIKNVQQVVAAKEDTEKNPQASGQARQMTESQKETYLANLEEQKASITAALENASDEEKTVRVEIDKDILFEAPESLTPDYGNAALNGGQSVRICNDGSVEIAGFADIGQVEPARIHIWKSSTGPFSN